MSSCLTLSCGSVDSMKQREHIEADLIQMTGLLHDLALCGIRAENLSEIRRLTAAVTELTRQADVYVPQVVTINGRRTGQACRDRLLTGSDLRV